MSPIISLMVTALLTAVFLISPSRTMVANDATDEIITGHLEKHSTFFNSKGDPSQLQARDLAQMAERADAIKADIEKAIIGLPLDVECDLRPYVMRPSGGLVQNRPLFETVMFNPKLVTRPKNSPILSPDHWYMGDEVFGLSCQPFSLPTITVLFPIKLGVDPRVVPSYHAASSFISDWEKGYQEIFHNNRPVKIQESGEDLYAGDKIRVVGKIEKVF